MLMKKNVKWIYLFIFFECITINVEILSLFVSFGVDDFHVLARESRNILPNAYFGTKLGLTFRNHASYI
jgi:hypothetical protein